MGDIAALNSTTFLKLVSTICKIDYVYILLQCAFIREGAVNNGIPVWSCSAAVPSSASLHSAKINGNKTIINIPGCRNTYSATAVGRWPFENK